MGMVCKADITDHDMVMCGINLKHKRCNRAKRIVQKRDVVAIKAEFLSTTWPDMSSKSVNDAAMDFMQCLGNIISRHTRKTRVSRTNFNLKPWITPGLMRCMRNRDRLHLAARSEPDNKVLQITYKRYRNFCNNLLRKLKNMNDEKLIQESKGNSKKFWKTIKSICHLTSYNKEPSELLTLQGANNEKESLDLCKPGIILYAPHKPS